MTPQEAAAVLMRANAAISMAAINDEDGTRRNWDALVSFVASRTDGGAAHVR